jgi:hypothetical protein
MSKRIIIAMLVTALLCGLIWYQESKTDPEAKREYDFSVKYSSLTYKPYDTKFAYQSFKNKAKKGFEINNKVPDSLNFALKGNGKIMVVMSPYFLPTQREVNSLLDFVERGNNLYISSFTVASPFLNSVIGRDSTDSDFDFTGNFPPYAEKGELVVNFNKADSLGFDKYFTYPGSKFSNVNGYFRDEKYGKINLILQPNGDAAFIEITLEKGKIFINNCPVTMSNYFLLHNDNYRFFNQIYQLIGAKDKSIIWDTYYKQHVVQRPEPIQNEPGESYFWKLVSKYPSLQWAIFTFFAAIGLFVLVYSRRLQIPVDVLPEPENNSVAFVKSIAGLYWLKQDHIVIANKISHQFYDYLSAKYRIPYKDITLDNATKIAEKSGKEQNQIEEILTIIKQNENNQKITKNQLILLYQKVYKLMNN